MSSATSKLDPRLQVAIRSRGPSEAITNHVTMLNNTGVGHPRVSRGALLWSFSNYISEFYTNAVADANPDVVEWVIRESKTQRFKQYQLGRRLAYFVRGLSPMTSAALKDFSQVQLFLNHTDSLPVIAKSGARRNALLYAISRFESELFEYFDTKTKDDTFARQFKIIQFCLPILDDDRFKTLTSRTKRPGSDHEAYASQDPTDDQAMAVARQWAMKLIDDWEF